MSLADSILELEEQIGARALVGVLEREIEFARTRANIERAQSRREARSKPDYQPEEAA